MPPEGLLTALGFFEAVQAPNSLDWDRAEVLGEIAEGLQDIPKGCF